MALVWIIAWLICGIIAGYIGQPKAIGCGCVVLGLLFGPLGILFAWLLPGNMKECPYCRSRIHHEASVCPQCRREIPVNHRHDNSVMMYTPPPFHAEADAYVQRGIELGNLEKHEEALKSFNKAIHLQPDNADAWNNKGHALMALGREKEAKEAFDIGYRLAMKE